VSGPVVALVDGEHHPAAVRDALDRLDPLAAIFCGGEEKLPPGPLERHYGRPVETDPELALRRLAPEADALVDLADEPALPASAKLRLAALALHLGLRFESPGLRLESPRYEPVQFGGPKLAVIGTGKRTGKTAVAGHWAGLLRERDPVIVCMGRGGPAVPLIVEPGPTLVDLLAIAERGDHAASDYLEDALLADVRTIGCRRVGGGLAGQPAESNVAQGGALAASLDPGAILFEGSGACVPPVEVDRTVCVAGAGNGEPFAECRLLRADLVLAADAAAASAEQSLRELGGSAGVMRFELHLEPVAAVADRDRPALFTTGAERCDGVEPVVFSANLARRGALAGDLDRAAAEGCDVYLTELKAAAIDTVARRALDEGARLLFLRNRPVGLDGDLDAELIRLASTP
jgi:cyclic 2,3-diphosphoglycerate synthetase